MAVDGEIDIHEEREREKVRQRETEREKAREREGVREKKEREGGRQVCMCI